MTKPKVVMIPCNHEYIRKLKDSLADKNVEVKLLKPFHYSTPLNFVKLLLRRISGFNIIHVHWLYIFPFPFMMKVFCAYSKFLGYKIVWEMHNIVSHSGKKRDYAMSKWFFEYCDGIIYHSQSDATRAPETLDCAPKVNCAIIYHPNFIGVYKNDVSKKDARRALGIPQDVKTLLCFGQIRANRGYEYLIDAIDGIDDLTLIVAGEVIDRQTYKYIRDHFDNDRIKVFAKWVDNDEVGVYFNACDVVVLPYSEITTSGVIPLAYSFSRPVIVSDIGGVGEVVKDKYGALVAPCDVKALKNAITKIFESNYDEMGKSAFTFAEEKLTWDAAAEKVNALYEKLLSCN